jgi:putative lipoic acid-binding regulatory protein
MTSPEEFDVLPGDHVFKVFGRHTPTFVQRVTAIVAASVGALLPEAVQVRESRRGTYLSITIVARVENRQQLEQAYAELRAEPEVLLFL